MDADWQLLRTFLAVADAGSLAGAARELGVAQPTVGRHVDELEAQLGLVLFERSRSGVTATEAGLSLVPAARAMRAEADRLLRIASGRSSQVAGPVRITASRVVGTHLLPPILVDLGRAHPELEIELVTSDAVQNLLARDADVAVRMARPQQRSLVARKVNELPVGAYASRGYVERHGRPADGAALLDHRLIGFDRVETIVEGMRAAGLEVTRESFAFRTDDQVAYIELVRAGAGVGFVGHAFARAEPDLVPLLPDLLPATIPMWLVCHREVHGSPRIRLVIAHLARALGALELGPPELPATR